MLLAPWGAKMCRNLRLLCRYAEMSIYDYVWDSISSSIIEISWRCLVVRIRSTCCFIKRWNCSLTASTVRTVGGAKIGRNFKNISRIYDQNFFLTDLAICRPSTFELGWFVSFVRADLVHFSTNATLHAVKSQIRTLRTGGRGMEWGSLIRNYFTVIKWSVRDCITKCC